MGIGVRGEWRNMVRSGVRGGSGLWDLRTQCTQPAPRPTLAQSSAGAGAVKI